ncbi:hypothetical protein VV02_22395 [Luteipulveratus mongoliensis]|uniref:histidine kinase n=1 Tax=Luteipulveratus mongoliensis TaxID=571913 RepID=A0A0K1JR66_9MICO|nr:hypothetical protein VV02_22395 [Luteipulveratus mongoliensis]
MWELYVVVGCVAAVAVVLVMDHDKLGRALVAVAAIVVLLIWTFTFGRRLLYSRQFGWQSTLFAGGVLAILAFALWFSAPATSLLPVIFPLAFMSLPLRWAVVATLVANVLPPLIVLLSQGSDSPDLGYSVAVCLMTFVVSPVIGVVITRTALLSEERASLLQDLAASRAESAQHAHEAGIAAERARLAREIHDTLAQGFTSVVTLVQAVESELDTDEDAARRHLTLIGTTAKENLAEARAMVSELTPTSLGDGDLVAALHRESERLAAETGIVMTVTGSPTLPPLGTAKDVVLLRATQEAFSNIRQHARASNASLDIDVTDGAARISVSDNGVGLVSEKAGFGLRGMRDRAEQVGGAVTVGPREGGGTVVRIEVPT